MFKREATVVNWQALINVNSKRNYRLFSRPSIYGMPPLKCPYLFGLLQGDGLDCPEELVLRVLSGLLNEHIRSIFKVLWQASQSRLSLHLVKEGRENHRSKMRRSQNLHYLIKDMKQFRVPHINKNLKLTNTGETLVINMLITTQDHHTRGRPHYLRMRHEHKELLPALTLWVSVSATSPRHQCHC